MTEDFEGGFPAGWTRLYTNPYGQQYVWGKRSCRSYQGQYSGWAIGGGANGGSLSCGSNYPGNNDSVMVYGPFSLADAWSAELNFYYWLNSEPDFDKLCAYGSVDGNNFWGWCKTGNSGGWKSYTLDLSTLPVLGDLTGDSQVWIGIGFRSDQNTNLSEGAYVDNIVLRQCTDVSCLGSPPLAPQGGKVTPDEMHVK